MFQKFNSRAKSEFTNLHSLLIKPLSSPSIFADVVHLNSTRFFKTHAHKTKNCGPYLCNLIENCEKNLKFSETKSRQLGFFKEFLAHGHTHFKSELNGCKTGFAYDMNCS